MRHNGANTFMHAWKSLVTSLLLVAGIVALSAAPQPNASKVAPLALLNDITVPEVPDLAVNEMFGLRLDGPG